MELIIYLPPPSLYKDLVHPLKGNADAVTTGKPDWTGNPLGDLSARGTGNRLYIYISTGVSTIYKFNQSYLGSHSLPYIHMYSRVECMESYVPITTDVLFQAYI